MFTLPDLYYISKRISPSPAPRWLERQNNRLELRVALEDEWGITLEGGVFRARAFKHQPDEEVTLQIEFPHDRRRNDNAVERIEWNTSRVHNNKGRGPVHLRYLMQSGTHLHGFDLNWLEVEQRMRKSNLPIAEPIVEPIQGFTELLAFSKKRFSISNLMELPHPPWEGALL